MLHERAFKLGTVWAVYVRPSHRRHGIATNLMEHVVAHWKNIGCQRGVLLHATDAGRRVYERCGFAPGSMLLLNLDTPSLHRQCSLAPLSTEVGVRIEQAGAEMDATVAHHWQIGRASGRERV